MEYSKARVIAENMAAIREDGLVFVDTETNPIEVSFPAHQKTFDPGRIFSRMIRSGYVYGEDFTMWFDEYHQCSLLLHYPENSGPLPE